MAENFTNERYDTELTVLADQLGQLVSEKNAAYGDSAKTSGDILRLLYPRGIRPDQYDNALLVVRVLDKLSRIAHHGSQDPMGEEPWKDIAGYGLLGWRMNRE